VVGDHQDLDGLEVLVATVGNGSDLEQALWLLGCVVLPSAPSAREASVLLRSFRPDVALIDVHLGDEAVIALAEELTDMGVPFALVTASEEACTGLEPALRDKPRLAKPFTYEDLRQALLQILDAPPPEA
jgi:response regulator of citrate/malate metabolism